MEEIKELFSDDVLIVDTGHPPRWPRDDGTMTSGSPTIRSYNRERARRLLPHKVMYGVPEDLPLQRFVGKDLNQICLGRFQIQFHFSGTGSINVEGRWELRDPAGELVDQEREHAERDCYRVHQIIDLPVTRFTIDPPRSFTLFFDGSYALTVFDDTPQYESFSVHLDGQASIYV